MSKIDPAQQHYEVLVAHRIAQGTDKRALKRGDVLTGADLAGVDVARLVVLGVLAPLVIIGALVSRETEPTPEPEPAPEARGRPERSS